MLLLKGDSLMKNEEGPLYQKHRLLTWTVSNFFDWVKQHNLRFTTAPVPEVLLTSGPAEQLDHWLSFFVLLYTRENHILQFEKPLYQLCGLLQHMCGTNPNAPTSLTRTSYKKLMPSLTAIKEQAALHRAILNNLFQNQNCNVHVYQWIKFVYNLLYNQQLLTQS